MREATNWALAMISGAPITKARAESLRMMEYSFDQAAMERRRAWGRIMVRMAVASLIPRALAARNWPRGKDWIAPRKILA